MNTTPKNVSDQEVDLAQVSAKINQGFRNMGTAIFNAINFLYKNALILLVLLIIGVVLGYFKDTSNKVYNHEIIVIPNFESADYLYGKIELINSKIKEGDTVYLKNLGLKYPKRISSLKIEPIIDPYNFIRNREDNFELLKLMAADGSIDKVMKDGITSKNYTYHRITFSTKGKASHSNTIEPLLKSFNDNAYLKTIQENIIYNTKQKIAYNQQTLNQINGLLNSFSSDAAGKGGKSGNLVYYNENTQLDEILQTKNNVENEQGYKRIDLFKYQKIIKDVSVFLNKEKSSSNMWIYPLLLIAIFTFGKFFLVFFRKQASRSRENPAI